MRKRNKSYIKVVFINFIKFILRIILFPFVIIYLICNIKNRKKQKEKITVFNMTQIDSLSGVDFEIFLSELFKKLGYDVKMTKASHDYGADLLISKNKKTSIVQAKCYSKAVGIKAIQEIVGAKKHYKAEDAIAVTNNIFSKNAEILALENDVKLLDRYEIEKLIKKYDLKIENSKNIYSAMSEKSKEEINRRFKHMI